MLVIRCVCGQSLEGRDENDLVRSARAHTDAAHGDLGLTDSQIRDFVAAALRASPETARVSAVHDPVVRALTPDLVDDYLRFFDQDAFADNPAWASCYCMFYLFGGTADEWEHQGAAENREGMSELIRAGRMSGYLAYADGKPVGWCNAAVRTRLPGFNRDGELAADEPERTGAVVCFVIAPPYRRHGLARRLLDAACEGFQQAGLPYVEGYPTRAPRSDAAAYHGPVELYRAAGFSPVREAGDVTVMRKRLTP